MMQLLLHHFIYSTYFNKFLLFDKLIFLDNLVVNTYTPLPLASGSHYQAAAHWHTKKPSVLPKAFGVQ